MSQLAAFPRDVSIAILFQTVLWVMAKLWGDGKAQHPVWRHQQQQQQQQQEKVEQEDLCAAG